MWDVNRWYDILKIVGVVTPIATPIVLGVIRFFRNSYKTFTHTLEITKNLEAGVKAISDDIGKINKELVTNGGSSLRDAVNRIEKNLRHVDFIQRSFINQESDLPIFTTDEHGRCVWVNQQYLDLMKVRIEDVIGTSWEILIEQNNRDFVRNEWYRAVSEKRPFDLVYNIVTTDGTNLKIRCKATCSETGYIGYIFVLPAPASS